MDLIIDACGWVAVARGRLNVDLELRSLLGQPEWVLPAGVQAELERLDQTERGLLLDLVRRRATVVPTPDGLDHPDDHIVALAKQRGAAVLTVDRALKARLAEGGVTIVEVVDGHRLRRIDP